MSCSRLELTNFKAVVSEGTGGSYPHQENQTIFL